MKDPDFVISLHEYYKGDKIPLDMNWYRNAHWTALNGIKKQIDTKIREKYKGFQLSSQKIKLIYHVYNGTHNIDIMNFVSVIDKFFLDAIIDKYKKTHGHKDRKKKRVLIDVGLLRDDNCMYVPQYDIRYKGKDPLNPRVEIKIKDIGESK